MSNSGGQKEKWVMENREKELNLDVLNLRQPSEDAQYAVGKKRQVMKGIRAEDPFW